MYDVSELKRDLKLIKEQPRLTKGNHDGELCDLFCDAIVVRANRTALAVLEDLKIQQAA